MALNLVPILLGLGAFYFISQKDDEEGLRGPSGKGDTGFGDAPCVKLEGIYKNRDSSKASDALAGTNDPNLQFLPLTQDAFNSVREFIVKEINDNPNAVHDAASQMVGGNPSADFADAVEFIKISTVRKAEKHLTAHIQPECPWSQKSNWSSRMELVHAAVNRLYDRIYCRNLPGVWIAAQGNNLPVTQAFYAVARNEMEALAGSNPNTSKGDSVELALNGIFNGVGCGWGGAYQIPFSDRQNDLIGAMGIIYDQVRA